MTCKRRKSHDNAKSQLSYCCSFISCFHSFGIYKAIKWPVFFPAISSSHWRCMVRAHHNQHCPALSCTCRQVASEGNIMMVVLAIMMFMIVFSVNCMLAKHSSPKSALYTEPLACRYSFEHFLVNRCDVSLCRSSSFSRGSRISNSNWGMQRFAG